MVQPADFGNLQDPARLRELNGPDVWGILVEREVRASLVIVGEIAGKDAAQVSFAEDENMIQTFAPDRADEPFREGILPRAVGRSQDFTDPQALDSLAECLPVDASVDT